MGQYLAFILDNETLALLVPIVALLIPIVAILSSHQQKMARIIHEGGSQESRAQIEALRGEIAQLKSLVHQQAIQMDNLLSAGRNSSATEIGARIEG